MTIIDTEPIDLSPNLPPFVSIAPETLASIGTLALPGQEVLIGTLDTTSYRFGTDEARSLADATLAIISLLDRDQKLVFGAAPDQDVDTLGIWLSRRES